MSASTVVNRVTPRSLAVSKRAFRLGDRVVWWKKTPGGGDVFPVLATALAVTPKRVKIDAQDEESDVVRYVKPDSLGHHTASPTATSRSSKKLRTRSPVGAQVWGTWMEPGWRKGPLDPLPRAPTGERLRICLLDDSPLALDRVRSKLLPHGF